MFFKIKILKFAAVTNAIILVAVLLLYRNGNLEKFVQRYFSAQQTSHNGGAPILSKDSTISIVDSLKKETNTLAVKRIIADSINVDSSKVFLASSKSFIVHGAISPINFLSINSVFGDNGFKVTDSTKLKNANQPIDTSSLKDVDSNIKAKHLIAKVVNLKENSKTNYALVIIGALSTVFLLVKTKKRRHKIVDMRKIFKIFAIVNATILLIIFILYRSGKFDEQINNVYATEMTSPNGGGPVVKADTAIMSRPTINNRLASSKSIIVVKAPPSLKADSAIIKIDSMKAKAAISKDKPYFSSSKYIPVIKPVIKLEYNPKSESKIKGDTFRVNRKQKDDYK